MGFPSPAKDYIETSLDWNRHLVQHPASTFPVRVASDSMEPLITKGSHILVDRSLTPRHRDIVMGVHQDEFMLRRYVQTEHGVFLIPENPQHPTLEIKKGDETTIWGIVTFSIQQHR